MLEGIQYQVQLITGLCGSVRVHSIPSPGPASQHCLVVHLKMMSWVKTSANIDLAHSKALVVPEDIQYHAAILLPYLVRDRTPGFFG